jgi:hypothetical protein
MSLSFSNFDLLDVANVFYESARLLLAGRFIPRLFGVDARS